MFVPCTSIFKCASTSIDILVCVSMFNSSSRPPSLKSRRIQTRNPRRRPKPLSLKCRTKQAIWTLIGCLRCELYLHCRLFGSTAFAVTAACNQGILVAAKRAVPTCVVPAALCPLPRYEIKTGLTSPNHFPSPRKTCSFDLYLFRISLQ